MLPIIFALLVLPPIAAALILIVRRHPATAQLTSALITSGITGAILTAFFAFASSSVPIAPYELSNNAWLPVFGQSLLSLYVGFGLGVIIAAVFALPYSLLRGRTNRTRPQAHIPPSHGTTNGP